MSKIESSLDKAFAKLVHLKNTGQALICKIWQKYLPQFRKLKKLDYASVKSFAVKFKWRILLVLILLYAASAAYDYFFPSTKKAGGPQTITSVVVEKKDIPLIIPIYTRC